MNQSQTPLGALFAAVIARDEAERAIAFAQLSAKAHEQLLEEDRYDAWHHAVACFLARDGWDLESLSTNIESSYPRLSLDDCYDIAEAAIAKIKGRQ